MTAPTSHVVDAQKLTADATIDLFEITFHGTGTIYRFWNGSASRVWQGHTYESLACTLTGEGQHSTAENMRPKLIVVNPAKILGPFAALGYFDLALVARKRLLQADFIADNNISQKRLWIVGRVIGVTSQILQLELRDTTDMPVWLTPRRTYNPSEGYPFVGI